MMIGPLLIGCIALATTCRAVIRSAASAGGEDITREDEPLFYWLCVAGGLGLATVMLYISLRG